MSSARPLLVALVLGAAACSGGDDAAPLTTATTAPATTERPTSPVVTVDGSPAATSDPAATSTASTESTTTTTIPPVPDTGVPGLESADRFCQAWSEFAGSFQALALASSFATDPVTARRAELAASPVIVAATSSIDDALPAALESERDALVEDLLGPFRRRSERNLTALQESGIAAEQQATLATTWLQALAVAGTDDPDVDVSVPDDLSASLDAVATGIAAEVPPISEDPSLITNAAIPQTEAYLVENCPDRGTLAGNDIIDG